MIIEAILLVLLISGGISLANFLKKTFTKFKPQTYDIVMLGPRGVGKTSVLAGIANDFERIAKGILSEENKELRELRLGQPSSTSERIGRTIKGLQATAEMVKGGNHPPEGVVPDVARNLDRESYTFYLSSSEADPNIAKTITLNFHDFPGGWMSGSDTRRKEVVDCASKARIVIVAIDAPYLMEEEGRYQEQRNRGEEVTNVLRAANAFASGPGLLLLVPNRCEKYLQDAKGGSRARMASAVKQHYAELINHYKQPQYKGRVRIAIVPVQTIGCIKFNSFSSARYFPPPDQTIPLPIFWPLQAVEALRYDPRFLEQIVWQIIIQVLRDAVTQDTKISDQFRKAMPKIEQYINKSEGFEVLQSGVEGVGAANA